ncbi:MAG: hypothetical protein ACK5LC_02555 [Coprobacillaceae bacterium]
MKKLIKVLATFILTFSIVGCGSGSSDKVQREVIDNYFEYIKDGDAKKLKKLLSKDIEDEFEALEFLESVDTAKEGLDEYEFGKSFEKEYASFIDEVCKVIISEYKIDEVEVDDDETTVEVSGKYVQVEDFDPDELDSTKELNEIEDDYYDGKLDSDEYVEAVLDYFDEEAENMFNEWKEALGDLKTKKILNYIYISRK